MSTAQKLVARAIAAVLVLGLLCWVLSRITTTRPALRESTRREIDSLDRSKPAHDSTRTANVAAESVSVHQATTAHASAVVTRGNADRIRRERDSLSGVADSLAAVALATDSANNEWRTAFDAEHMAKLAADRLADSLAKVADSAERAYQGEKIARDSADVRATRDSTRADKAETAMHDAAHDAETAGQCRIARFIPCPSRKVAVAVGVAIGTGAVIVIRSTLAQAKKAGGG